MLEKDNSSQFLTFPRTFEKYKWYNPILVLIVSLIIVSIFSVIITFIFNMIYGLDFVMSFAESGYEVLNTESGQIFMDLSVIIMIPSLYIASKIVKDRPFSSYASSHEGFNFKLYLKAFIIPFIFFILVQLIDVAINEPQGTNHFTIVFFILSLIMVPLQCIAEEYVFRGLIMQTLGSWFKIPVLAIIVQALIFAMLHGYNSLGMIEIFISGIIFGVLALKTNGIEVSSAMHTANNLSISLLVMFGLTATSSSVQLNDLVIAVVYDIIVFAILLYIGKKTGWFGEIKS